MLYLNDESLLLELPYEVSEETNEYGLAPERCKLVTSTDCFQRGVIRHCSKPTVTMRSL